MGILENIFRTSKPAKLYVDAGTRLTANLIRSLQLKGWENLRPVYSPAEIKVIEGELAFFQRGVDARTGGRVVFHPELAGEIQNTLIASALQNYAGTGWRFEDKRKPPVNWKLRVSTCLKAAWAGRLNPNCLLDMAEMLVSAGYTAEAKASLEVVLLFPTYAGEFFGGADSDGVVTNRIVNQAKEMLQAF